MQLYISYLYFILLYSHFIYTTSHCKKSSKCGRSKRQSSTIGDESNLNYEVISSALPTNPDGSINYRYMPTLGNGYIGLTVYENKLYLNSVFNGAGGKSHRAEIPALVMARINISNPEYERKAIRKYSFNALEGYFKETIRSDIAIIEQKTYVHQKYIRLLVTDVTITYNSVNIGGGSLDLTVPTLSSPDFKFDKPIQYLGNWQVKGTTYMAESGESTQNIYLFYQRVPSEISITGSQRSVNYTWIMSVDRQEGNSRSEFLAAQTVLQNGSNSNYYFFMEHVNAWNKTWSNGFIELEGSKTANLPKATWMAQAYILMSLPSENPFLPPSFQEVFYGCSRASLGKGSAGKNYQGHIMWDNEFFLLPAILPFHPTLAKAMLRYRGKMGKGATENAKKMGSEGYHFPWESGSSGLEVSDFECSSNDTLCLQRRIYVTAGVAFGIRLYNSMTRDRDFGINPEYMGCDMSREIAKFLASRAVFNRKKGRFDIDDITGPDESHPRIKNNAFTLAAISLAIHYARYYSCICQRNDRQEIPDEYIQKALYLNIPFDNIRRIHYQFEGYKPGESISQADAVLLNAPLNWNYSLDIMRNDLNLYETLVSEKTPAMTWSWYTIGFKWTNEFQKMNSYFFKSYNDYTQHPFRIWTEYSEGSQQENGAVNFLPGMGAFLQSLIYGFAGFRIRPDRLEIFNPMPPTDINLMRLNNFQYLGSNLTFAIEVGRTTITVNGINPSLPLFLKRNMTGAVEETLMTGSKIEIAPADKGFYIYTTVTVGCEYPRDYIYMPWGYSPELNSALKYSSLNSLYFLILLRHFFTLFFNW